MGHGYFNKKSMIKKIFTGIAFATCIAISAGLLLPGIKGTNSDPSYYEVTRNREVGGPFESSGSTSRYVLTEAIAKDSRIDLTVEEAQFASPDVAGNPNKYFSLFMPGVSYAAVPFYKIGNVLGSGQMGAFSLNIVLALLNVVLISLIVRKLTGGLWIGLFSGLTFLFATNALPYSFYFTQHQLGTFCLLLILWLYQLPRNMLTNILAGFTYGYAIFTDMPNAIILLPAMVAIGLQNFSLINNEKKLSLKIKLSIVGLLVGLIPMLYALGIYNQTLTGSYTNLPQFIGRSSDFSEQPEKQLINKPVEELTKFDHIAPFFSRLTINGFYILLVSDERGWLVYSPIVFLGLLGLYKALKEKGETQAFAQVVLSSFLIALLLYSMFGDPWGGWSFGPRYMIPAAAALCIMLGYSAAAFKGKSVYTVILFVLLSYSIYVNALGVMTTTQIPPKQEAIYLNRYVPYTYAYNIGLIEKNQSRSYMYNAYLQDKISIKQFHIYYAIIVLGFLSSVYLLSVFEKHKKI